MAAGCLRYHTLVRCEDKVPLQPPDVYLVTARAFKRGALNAMADSDDFSDALRAVIDKNWSAISDAILRQERYPRVPMIAQPGYGERDIVDCVISYSKLNTTFADAKEFLQDMRHSHPARSCVFDLILFTFERASLPIGSAVHVPAPAAAAPAPAPAVAAAAPPPPPPPAPKPKPKKAPALRRSKRRRIR